MEQSRELIDLLEQSLIRNQDNWDILMNYPKLYRQPLISSSSFLIWNLIHIGKDLQSIPDQKLRISTKMLLDRIQSLILYCSSGQEVNFMDSQIRLSLFWTLQIFRDSFPQPVTNSIKEVFEKKKPFKTFLETDYQSLFARNSNFSFKKKKSNN